MENILPSSITSNQEHFSQEENEDSTEDSQEEDEDTTEDSQEEDEDTTEDSQEATDTETPAHSLHDDSEKNNLQVEIQPFQNAKAMRSSEIINQGYFKLRGQTMVNKNIRCDMFNFFFDQFPHKKVEINHTILLHLVGYLEYHISGHWNLSLARLPKPMPG